MSIYSKQQLSNPDTGKYNVSESKDKTRVRSPACTIGNSPRFNNNNKIISTPGPSHYNYDANVIKYRGPTFHIQTKMSPKRDDNSPGPCSYNSDRSSLSSHRRGSSYIFGNSRRPSMDDTEQCKTPGPGQYDNSKQKSINGDRGLKFGLKIPEKTPDSPGPASY